MNKAIFKAIWQRIKEEPQNVSLYEDMFSAIRIYEVCSPGVCIGASA